MSNLENAYRQLLAGKTFKVIQDDINKSIDIDPFGNTLLHTAVVLKKVNTINELIKSGADLDVKNKLDNNVYDLLATSGHGNIIKNIITTKNKMYETKIKQLKQINTKLHDNITVLEDENDKLNEENNQLKKSEVNLKKRIREYDDEIICHKRRKVQLESEVVELKQEKDKLQKSVTNLIVASYKK
jgi:ankyrin repeat protein